MNLEHRLARCKAYLEKALLDPIANKLYIEDLELSIDMFSKAVNKPTLVQKGWIDD